VDEIKLDIKFRRPQLEWLMHFKSLGLGWTCYSYSGPKILEAKKARRSRELNGEFDDELYIVGISMNRLLLVPTLVDYIN